jgi:hypothetical protein
VPAEDGSTDEHEHEEQRRLDAQHPGRRPRRSSLQRLDERDAAHDAEYEDHDRDEPLGGEAPVAVADEHPEAHRVAAHVRDEEPGEGEEPHRVHVAGHPCQRERPA